MLFGIMQKVFSEDFFLSFFNDAIGNMVLCIACVLMLSYLRETPPKFENKRVALAGVVLSVGAFISRVLVRFIITVNEIYGEAVNGIFDKSVNKILNGKNSIEVTMYFLDKFDNILLKKLFMKELISDDFNFDNIFKDSFCRLIVKGWNWQGFECQKNVFIINIVTTLIGFISICAGAFILMKLFKAKHIVPMAVIQLIGFLLKEISEKPYKNMIELMLSNHKIEKTQIFGYNAFAYGCFMILMIISYILVTQKVFSKFWTKDIHVIKHIASLVILIAAYTFLVFFFNRLIGLITEKNGNNSQIINALNLIINIVLAISLLIVPRRTYNLTCSALQNDFYEVQRENEVEHYSYSVAQIEAERKYMHDLPMHFRRLNEMAEKTGAEEISQYIFELDKDLADVKCEFTTGNTHLDEILIKESEAAREKNINISFKGMFPNKGIREKDITTIFINLIRNAVEACKKVSGKREIIISSTIHENRVYVTFSNPFEQKPQKKNGKLLTTKKNKGFHGYGISSVESAVSKEEYDGTFLTREEGRTFIAEVNLKFKN